MFSKIFRQTISEHTTYGEILRVEAKDDDSDEKNKKLRYTIRETNLPFGVNPDGQTAVINITKVCFVFLYMIKLLKTEHVNLRM